MTEERPLAPIHARTAFEARILLAILDDAGIPAFGEGSGALQDEFALSQRLMNTGGVRIFVEEARLEDAQAAIATAREAGKAMDAEDHEAPQDSPQNPC